MNGLQLMSLFCTIYWMCASWAQLSQCSYWLHLILTMRTIDYRLMLSPCSNPNKSFFFFTRAAIALACLCWQWVIFESGSFLKNLLKDLNGSKLACESGHRNTHHYYRHPSVHEIKSARPNVPLLCNEGERGRANRLQHSQTQAAVTA